MTLNEARTLARKLKMPKFMYDSEDCIIALAAFGSHAATVEREALIALRDMEIYRLKIALESVSRYGLDTLSGRIDGPDDREWQRTAVNEMTRRAREALAKSEHVIKY